MLEAILRLAGMAAALAVGLVLLMVLAQDWLIFPRWAMGPGLTPPDRAERLEARAPDGTGLEGLLLPARETGEARPLLLAFGGNGWDAVALALHLQRLLPDHAVAAFHYRGYGPSEGRPGGAALMADAVVVHDHLVQHLQGRPEAEAGIVALGISLGGGPAAEVAAQRPVAGLVLVTPFDSLLAMAQAHYPWLPVRWLLRHRMEVAEAVARVTAPVALIAAGRDRVVPPERTAPLRQAARRLVADITVEGAGHNDLHDRPEHAAALRRALQAIAAAQR